MATVDQLSQTRLVSENDRLTTAEPLRTGSRRTPHWSDECAARLERDFRQPFLVINAEDGRTVRDVPRMPCDLYSRLALCAEVAKHGRPEIIEEVAPLTMLAVPLQSADMAESIVAVSTFVTEQPRCEADVAVAAHAFGTEPRQAFHWAQSCSVWPPHAIVPLAEALTANLAGRQQILQLREQVADTSAQLLSTFEEITLLHRLTQHLSLSASVRELCEQAARWLADVVPAECIAVKLTLHGDGSATHMEDAGSSVLISHCPCPLAEREVDALIKRLGQGVGAHPIVLNRNVTGAPNWKFPRVKELICVPIAEGSNLFGWLMAFNHRRQPHKAVAAAKFSTVEVNLMSSVAVILGIHSGNSELYREQSDFFESIVSAFTSAIDAKDQYTCGHSDRVARISVCLARQLGCSAEELNMIYLSGLLHDIGKIGIDDHVLHKPGMLTAAELDHIKQHPELGYRILQGVKRLEMVLPVVLHHHEAWDGSGYPHGLRGEECPKLARIVAVADSIDAMSSDRPYRRGLADHKLDRILREGAGKQWDAHVINAVFQVRDEVRRIGRAERAPLSLDVQTWQMA